MTHEKISPEILYRPSVEKFRGEVHLPLILSISAKGFDDDAENRRIGFVARRRDTPPRWRDVLGEGRPFLGEAFTTDTEILTFSENE